MEPVLGSLIITAIQAIAEVAKQAGMDEAEATKYFTDGFNLVKANVPGDLPDAR